MKITKEMLNDYVSSKPWGGTFKKIVSKQNPLKMDYDKYVEFVAEKGSDFSQFHSIFLMVIIF